MGNTDSTTAKVDLSLAELQRTSDTDKEWLGVSEEQLLDDSFTNEKIGRAHV